MARVVLRYFLACLASAGLCLSQSLTLRGSQLRGRPVTCEKGEDVHN